MNLINLVIIFIVFQNSPVPQPRLPSFNLKEKSLSKYELAKKNFQEQEDMVSEMKLSFLEQNFRCIQVPH